MAMQFVIEAFDKPRSGEIRALHRETHRDRLRNARTGPVKVLAAGPFLDAADQLIGSLIIVEADSHTEVERFVAADVYSVNGLYETVVIRPFKWTIGAPA